MSAEKEEAEAEYVPLTRETYRPGELPTDENDPNYLRRWREALRITAEIYKEAGIDVTRMEATIDTFDPRPTIAEAEARSKAIEEIQAQKRATNYGYYSDEYMMGTKSFIRRNPRGENSRQAPTVSAIDGVKAKEIAAQSFEEYTGLDVGEFAEDDLQLCHWHLAVDYPNLYIGKANYVKAAYLFEDILEGFVWDFFYLYHPVNHRQAPKLFVPTEQFVRYLDYVNATVGVKLTIPQGVPGQSFAVTFGDMDGCGGPRYLGRSTQKAEFEALLKTQPGWNEDDTCEGASQAQISGLISKLRRFDLGDEKKKEKDLAALGREASAKQKRHQLQLVQHLLGLRPETKSYQDADGRVLQLDTTKPAPFEPYRDAIIASIDIEVAEQASSTIYEIGISVLDTRQLAKVAPGDDGRYWFPLIKSYHLLTYEYRTCRNTKYVQGCPDMFRFGVSELPLEADLANRVLAILKQHVYPDGATDNDWKLHRPLVVTGHGFRSDAGFLKSIGVDLHTDMYSHTAVVDTQHLDQTLHDLKQPRGLGAVLNELDIRHNYLHNAGNDAAYTLQALVSMAVRARRHELAEIAELEEELGADSGSVPAPPTERTQAVKNFEESLRKKRRPGEPSHEWRLRYHGCE